MSAIILLLYDAWILIRPRKLNNIMLDRTRLLWFLLDQIAQKRFDLYL